MTNKQDELKCVMPNGIFHSVSDLMSNNVRANRYSLQSLSSFIETVILYDKIILFEHYPLFLKDKHYLKSLTRNNFGYELHQAGILDVTNPYDSIFGENSIVEVLSEISKSNLGFKIKGDMGGATTLLAQPSFLDFKNDPIIKNYNERLAIESFLNLASQKFLDKLADPSEFLKRYTTNTLWRIEMGKIAQKQTFSDGLIISPDWSPFWLIEKQFIRSQVHHKFTEYSEYVKAKNFNSIVDLSPLTVIALDTTLSKEMFVNNLLLMRRDYSELRSIGRKYRQQLKDAETYSEIDEVTNDWSIKWDLIMKKIRKTETPLNKRIFCWDSLKSLSPIKIGSKICYEIFSEINNRNNIKTINIINNINNEFMSSRLVSHRINELFGGIEDLTNLE
jgi:hypothetical protein